MMAQSELSFLASELVAQLGGTLQGHDLRVRRLTSLQQATVDDISFLSNPRLRADALASCAGVLIVTEKTAQILGDGRTLIVADDPYLYFARVARLFHPVIKAKPGVHPTAVVAASAQLAADCEIGPHVVVGERTVIGSGSRLLAGVVVEDDCVIGTDCVLHANVVVYPGCRLGDRVELHSGAIIGADGFGLAWDKQDNYWYKIVQTGGVVLGDDVEIGANTTIDRGAIEDTVVENGVKIDNQVQIGHNDKIGAHTAIAGCTGIAGSTEIGPYCIIGGAAMIAGHLTIPAKTMIAAATPVSHSIKQADHYAAVYPLQTHKEWVKNAAYLRHLREMHHQLKKLEQLLMAQQTSEIVNQE